MYAELDPLFAADLFFWFFNFEDSEVPAVNKPRRACLYVTFCFKAEHLLVYQSSFLLIRSELRDDLLLIVRTFFPFHFPSGDKAYALISTSTPEGKSNLLNASTVLEEEV